MRRTLAAVCVAIGCSGSAGDFVAPAAVNETAERQVEEAPTINPICEGCGPRDARCCAVGSSCAANDANPRTCTCMANEKWSCVAGFDPGTGGGGP